MRYVIFTSALVLSFCSGCGSGATTVNDFLKDPENGYTNTHIGDHLLFDVTQMPARLLALENLDPDDISNDNKFEAALKEYEEFLHFKLELVPRSDNEVLSRKTLGQSEYQDRLINLAYGFEHSVFLITENDTLSCAYAHLVREFDLNTGTRINFGFRKPRTQSPTSHFFLAGNLHFLEEPPFFITMQMYPKQIPDNLLAL